MKANIFGKKLLSILKEDHIQENRKEAGIAVPTKQQHSDLDEAKTVLHQCTTNFGLYDDVTVHWFVRNRKDSVNSYELAREDHCPELVQNVCAFFQECFTKKEVEMLREYTNKELNFTCEIGPLFIHLKIFF